MHVNFSKNQSHPIRNKCNLWAVYKTSSGLRVFQKLTWKTDHRINDTISTYEEIIIDYEIRRSTSIWQGGQTECWSHGRTMLFSSKNMHHNKLLQSCSSFKKKTRCMWKQTCVNDEFKWYKHILYMISVTLGRYETPTRTAVQGKKQADQRTKFNMLATEKYTQVFRYIHPEWKTIWIKYDETWMRKSTEREQRCANVVEADPPEHELELPESSSLHSMAEIIVWL